MVNENPALARGMRELMRLRQQSERHQARRVPDPSTMARLVDDALDVCSNLIEELARIDRARALAEAEAADARTRTGAILESMPVACVTTDAAGTILDVNPAAATLFNVSARHIRQRLLLHFVEDRAGFSQLLRTAQSHAAPLEVRTDLRPRERAPRPVRIVLIPDQDSSEWRWFLLPASEADVPAAAEVA